MLRKVLISLGLIAIIVNFTGCQAEDDRKALKILDDYRPEGDGEVKYGEWIRPSRSGCENNGGDYFNPGYLGSSFAIECSADWENANTICDAIGYTLPTIKDLEKVVTDCGGVLDKWQDNISNQSYQSCYKDKGFKSDSYWSSTTSTSDSSEALNFNINSGNKDSDNKEDKHSVHCIK